MHETLSAVRNRLDAILGKLRSLVPNDEPFSIAHNNWSFPGLSRQDLVNDVRSLINDIDTIDSNDLGPNAELIEDYPRRLQYLEAHTIPQIWGSSQVAIPTFLSTMHGLRAAIAPLLHKDERAEALKALAKMMKHVRSIEAQIRAIEPRTATLTTMVERIESAYEAADQLPVDLEALDESKQKIEAALSSSHANLAVIERLNRDVHGVKDDLDRVHTTAEDVLRKCETAYAASTSVGLAAAFSERSSALSISMWVWVAGLVAALGFGSYFGAERIRLISELFKQSDLPTTVIVSNVALSVFSVGAPIWFAWLATKQIGQRFRLAEDYAFKASISRAYEGFRREVASHGAEMQEKLLNAALNRLDELPLRLVETENHGSPWHELASSKAVNEAVKSVPEFTSQVKELANSLLRKSTPAAKEAGD